MHADLVMISEIVIFADRIYLFLIDTGQIYGWSCSVTRYLLNSTGDPILVKCLRQCNALPLAVKQGQHGFQSNITTHCQSKGDSSLNSVVVTD